MSTHASLPFGVRVRDMTDAHPEVTTASQAVLKAGELGASSLEFPALSWISADFDAESIRHVAREATDACITASADLGVLNPTFPERCTELLNAGDGDLRIGAERLIALAGEAGLRDLHFSVGQLEDRASQDFAFSEQCLRTTDFLGSLAPVAAASGVTLVMKTHEEMTSQEVARVVSSVDSPALRVGFSPVNLLVSGDDPVLATERLLPYIRYVFLDDAAMIRCDQGLYRQMATLGEGTVNWQQIVDLCQQRGRGPLYVLDIHRARFTVDLFDPMWPRLYPDASLDEVLSLCGRAGARKGVTPEPATRFRIGVSRLRGIDS